MTKVAVSGRLPSHAHKLAGGCTVVLASFRQDSEPAPTDVPRITNLVAYSVGDSCFTQAFRTFRWCSLASELF